MLRGTLIFSVLSVPLFSVIMSLMITLGRFVPCETVAFASEQRDNFDLYLWERGHWINVTQHPAKDLTPLWLGKDRIAWVSDRSEEGLFNVYLQPIRGGEAQLITQGGIDPFMLSASPDHRTIVYSVENDVMIHDLISGSIQPIAATLEIENGAAWSPLGNAIAYVSSFTTIGNNLTEYRINRYDLETGRTRMITDSFNNVYQLAWSPDGRFLAFEGMETRAITDLDIYVYDLQTHTYRDVSQNTIFDSSPAWSSDGTRIAFVSIGNSDSEIITASLANGTRRPITRTPWMELSPAWRPGC